MAGFLIWAPSANLLLRHAILQSRLHATPPSPMNGVASIDASLPHVLLYSRNEVIRGLSFLNKSGAVGCQHPGDKIGVWRWCCTL
jgi:hypothetical protein